MKRLGCLATVLICLLAALPAVYGQSVTGQISGTVVDPAGATVPGATVQLTHDLSQQVRKFVTESNGSFIFTSLVPGSYSLHVAQAGFKGYDQKSITVAAQERVDMHEIHLAVGDVTSTVEVQGQTVHVATDSSDRSISIGLQQIMDTPTRGRNPVSLIMTLPGVQSVNSNDYRGWGGGGIPGVNGGQQGQIILNMDGAASQDSGNLNTGYINPSMDAIGEVKLLVSNYTAEYGGRTAGQLTHEHQKRHAPVPRKRLLVLPPREFERQHFLQQQDQRAEAALPLSESRRHHRRSADYSGHAVQ